MKITDGYFWEIHPMLFGKFRLVYTDGMSILTGY